LTKRETIDLSEALRRDVRLIAPILAATLLLYIPFLIASEIVGELLRWSPGIIRLPIYILVLALLVVQIGLALMHPLAICGIVIHRLHPIASIEQSWQLIREHPEEMLVIAAALGALGLVFGALAYLVISPVAGVSLLSILLAGPLNSFANLGLTLSFTALSIISVAILAPARAYQFVALTLAYQKWTDKGSDALEPGR
jgi:membrane-anchored glycerophosphoryl diester phosphodiesterase (GDPDase)